MAEKQRTEQQDAPAELGREASSAVYSEWDTVTECSETTESVQRDTSGFSEVSENATKPKKAKKRVGRIGFAEVIVTEQVIRHSDEDLAMRRDHWRAIQDKAEDPTAVFSNESSKANSKAPSGKESPLRISHGDRSFDLSPRTAQGTAQVSANLDFKVLHAELLKLQNDSEESETAKIVSISANIDDSPDSRRLVSPESVGDAADLSLTTQEDGLRVPENERLRSQTGSPSKELKADRLPDQEPPGPGWPNLQFPNLDAFITQKQENEIFTSMAQKLLEYIEFWPTARKSKADRTSSPRDTKTASDFLYVLKRWLIHCWKAGLSLKNAHHVGTTMIRDKGLLHGHNPLIERRLDTSTSSGEGEAVRLVPVVDTLEEDWLDLAERFKHFHLIGDKFFPNDQYAALTGIGSLISDNASKVEPTFSPRSWEHDSSVGISVDFVPRTERINWDASPDGKAAVTKYNISSTEGIHETTSLADNSESAHQSMHDQGQGVNKSSERDPSTGETNSIGRSSNKMPSRQHLPKEIRLTNGRTSKRTVTSETREAQQIRRRRREVANETNLEHNNDFIEFTRSKTGQVRLSQKKLDALKYAYREELLYRKRVHAAKSVSLLIKEAANGMQIKGLDEGARLTTYAEKGDEVSDCEVMSSSSTQTALGKNPGITNVAQQQKEAAQRFKSDVEKAYSSKAKCAQPARSAQNVCWEGNSDKQDSDGEAHVDEFLRSPMQRILSKDETLVKSLGMSPLAAGGEQRVSRTAQSKLKPDALSHLHHGRPAPPCVQSLPGSAAAQQRAHLHPARELATRPATKLPDLKRPPARGDHQTVFVRIPHAQPHARPEAQAEAAPQRQSADGAITASSNLHVPARRTAHSAFGHYGGQLQALLNMDLLKSPYAQRIHGPMVPAHRKGKGPALAMVKGVHKSAEM